MRIMVWIVATPLVFALSILIARRIGLLTTNRLLDAVLNRNFASYVPLITVGVVLALLNAIAVHGAIQLLSSRRGRVRRG